MVALYGARTFDAFESTLEATLSAGKLGVLRDIDLRDALGAWVRTSGDRLENATELRAESQRVRFALEAFGGPFFGLSPLGPGPPRVSVMARIDGPTMARIRDDDDAMGRVRNKVYTQEIYLRELIQLQTLLDSVVTLIEDSLN